MTRMTRQQLQKLSLDDLQLLVGDDFVSLLPEGATFTQVNTSQDHPIGVIRFPWGCSLWVGNLCGQGYTSMTNPQTGKTVRGHNWMADIHYGPRVDGWDTHHICGNKACCEPRHLERMPHGDHMRTHRK